MHLRVEPRARRVQGKTTTDVGLGQNGSQRGDGIDLLRATPLTETGCTEFIDAEGRIPCTTAREQTG